MDVCLLWVLCVLSGRGICDELHHSSRGVLPTVMRRCVWSRNLKNEEPMVRVGPQRHKKKLFLCSCVLELLEFPWQSPKRDRNVLEYNYWNVRVSPHIRSNSVITSWKELYVPCRYKRVVPSSIMSRLSAIPQSKVMWSRYRPGVTGL